MMVAGYIVELARTRASAIYVEEATAPQTRTARSSTGQKCTIFHLGDYFSKFFRLILDERHLIDIAAGVGLTQAQHSV
jgi:hypothetical protein